MIELSDKDVLHFLLNRGQLVTQVKSFWLDAMPESVPPPDRSIVLSWLASNSLGSVIGAVGECTRKAHELEGAMTHLHALKFVQSILTSQKKERLAVPRLPQNCYAETAEVSQ